MADVGQDSPVFHACVKAIEFYRNTKYYDTKTKRIEALSIDSHSAALEVFIAVLPIKELSPIQSVATQIGNRLGYQAVLDGVKTAAEIMAVCEASGLYTLYHSTSPDNDTGTLGVKPNYKLSSDTEAFIAKTMYLPPMIQEPEEWTDNAHGGYLEGTGSVILGNINHHHENQALDAINIIQRIPWELNIDMLEYEECPNKTLDTPDKTKQFNDMKHKSRSVYDEMLGLGNRFFFTWKYDKRGRMYSQGYHINLQSTEYKKSILQFSNKELIC